MHTYDTDLLFPPRVIPALRNLRGKRWKVLVDRAAAADEVSIKCLAFILMMARLGGCASCNANSYRAMRGCTQCARQTLRRYRGTDDELTALYRAARLDIEQYMRKKGLLT